MCKETHPRVRESIANYTLFDDAFMSAVFDGNNELTQYVLRIILQKDDLEVTSVESQHDISNLSGRGARLDIEAIDSEGNYYDVEVQRARMPGLFRRARFYQSMMDHEHVEKGEDFQNLRRSYIIFILDYDLCGCGLPIYHVISCFRETGESYDDGREILYVNGTYRNTDEEIGKLMHDMSCSDYHQIESEIIRETVRPYKEPGSKEAEKMSELVDRIFKEELDEMKKKMRQELTEKDKIIEMKTLEADEAKRRVQILERYLAENGIEVPEAERQKPES